MAIIPADWAASYAVVGDGGYGRVLAYCEKPKLSGGLDGGNGGCGGDAASAADFSAMMSSVSYYCLYYWVGNGKLG